MINEEVINFMSLDECKEMWFNPLEEIGVSMDMLVGNHDIYYKNTLRVNAPTELLGEYKNLTIHDSPCTINRDGLDILLLPWICDDNKTESYKEIAESTADVYMGHFELNGFEASGHMMTGGMDPSIFNKFKKVFTGHYHRNLPRNLSHILVTLVNYTGMITDRREDSMSS